MCYDLSLYGNVIKLLYHGFGLPDVPSSAASDVLCTRAFESRPRRQFVEYFIITD